MWNSEQAEFDDALRRRAPVQKDLFSFEESESAATILRRLPSGWRAPRFAASVKWHPEFRHTTASAAAAASYDWVSGTGRHVGTVVHALLNQIAKDSESWRAERLNEIRPLIKAELLRLGVPRRGEPEASEQVRRAIANTLASERGRWVLHPHTDVRSEWPISGTIQDTLINGIIDRTFRDQEGRLWIIDFKTSEHEGGMLESFLDNEQRRYRTQLENYATLMSRMEKGPFWLGLYFPLLDGWREWEFVEEAALTA